jgi:hypothetical protein
MDAVAYSVRLEFAQKIFLVGVNDAVEGVSERISPVV